MFRRTAFLSIFCACAARSTSTWTSPKSAPIPPSSLASTTVVAPTPVPSPCAPAIVLLPKTFVVVAGEGEHAASDMASLGERVREAAAQCPGMAQIYAVPGDKRADKVRASLAITADPLPLSSDRARVFRSRAELGALAKHVPKDFPFDKQMIILVEQPFGDASSCQNDVPQEHPCCELVTSRHVGGELVLVPPGCSARQVPIFLAAARSDLPVTLSQ